MTARTHLMSLTVKDIRPIAAALGITGLSRMRKDDLVSAIIAAEDAVAPVTAVHGPTRFDFEMSQDWDAAQARRAKAPVGERPRFDITPPKRPSHPSRDFDFTGLTDLELRRDCDALTARRNKARGAGWKTHYGRALRWLIDEAQYRAIFYSTGVAR